MSGIVRLDPQIQIWDEEMFNGKIWILSLFTLLFLSACNEQEFYEKEFLETAVEQTPDIGDFKIPDAVANNNPGTNDGTNNGGNSGNNGGSNNNGGNNGGTTNNGGNNGGTTNNGGNNGGSNNNGGNNGGTANNGGNNGGSNNNGGSTTGGTNTGGNNNGGSTTGGTNNGGSNNNGGSTTGGTNTGGNNNGGSTNNNVCSVGAPTDTQDQFIQNTAQNSKVDILWVVDDSGSMGDNQRALANNFDSFIEDFIDEGIDFKMGITTTDPRSGRSGMMVGDSDQLTSDAAAADEATFKANFKNWIKVGTRGSGDERGLQTSRDFLTSYNNFLRDDAYLVVVYVSDEEDHSRTPVADYLSFYQNLKASAGMFKAYSIVTTAKSMPYAKSTESIGERYMEISRATSGDIADITDNFHQTLKNFSTSILNLLDSFPLSAEPINADIEITVDGVAVTTGWEYIENNRTIKFDASAIPSEGEIVIAYYQKCE